MTSSASVVARGENVYASPSRLYVTTSRWGGEFADVSRVSTELHGFDISSPDATAYVASGQVAGHLLDQFALSEHQGYLRVATTTRPPWVRDRDLQARPETSVTVFA